MTSFLLKPITDSFVDSVEAAVAGTVVEVAPVPGTAVAVVEEEDHLGTVVGELPGTVLAVGLVLELELGTEPVPGTVVEVDPGTAAVGTVAVGRILAVGEVAVQAQTEGEPAGLGPSRASELHFYHILAPEVRTGDYRSLQEIKL